MERRVRGNSHARCEAGEKVESGAAHRSDLTYRYRGVPQISNSGRGASSGRATKMPRWIFTATSPRVHSTPISISW